MSADRTLRVSEIFASIQGEGASAGAPSVFLRLATCNLRCGFCDTRYTWDWSAHSYEREVRHAEVPAIAEELLLLSPPRLVVTGGEPLLQQGALGALLSLLPAALPVEVETNGTLTPAPALALRVDQWNVSPKLSNSGESPARRFCPEALTALRATGRAWLKIVVGTDADAAEARELIDGTGWPRDRVLLMPLGATRRELRAHAPTVERLSRELSVGLSPRLHVERWDGQRGV